MGTEKSNYIRRLGEGHVEYRQILKAIFHGFLYGCSSVQRNKMDK